MAYNHWPPEVQARFEYIFETEGRDAWIFQGKKDGLYFAVGGIDSLGIATLLMIADIVKYKSQRMKDIKWEDTMGYYHG